MSKQNWLFGIAACAALAGTFLLSQGDNRPARAQSNFSASQLYCHVIGPPQNWLPCDTTTPLVVSSTFSPSGTQDVNLTKVAGAAVALGQTTMSASLPVTLASNQSIISVTSGGSAITDRTITSASGSSQQLMASNASRKSLIVENTGNANCGVNPTGGTAAIGGAGTLTLAPLGSYSPKVSSLAAITVICTAGQPIYAEES